MLIVSNAALAANLERLIALDPVMAELHAAGVAPPLRKRDGGFPGLIGIIMAQQLSVASAAAITARLHAAISPLTPQGLLEASTATLVAAGLSQPKIKAARSVAQAAVDGVLDFASLADMSGEDAHAALVAVKGVGPWTADIYLLFCLGHPDVFPAGDLALQEAARLALHLDARPDTALMATLARRWSPSRGAAALMLWAYYAVTRGREGVIVTPPGQTVPPGLPLVRRTPHRSWRPQPREALSALPPPSGSATSQPPLPWPDLLEGLHAGDPALRHSCAASLGDASIRAPSMAALAMTIADRLGTEEDTTVRRELILAAGRLPDAGAGANRLFASLWRIASGQGGWPVAHRVAAIRALDAMASQRPALSLRLRRGLANLDVSASPQMARAIAQRLAAFARNERPRSRTSQP